MAEKSSRLSITTAIDDDDDELIVVEVSKWTVRIRYVCTHSLTLSHSRLAVFVQFTAENLEIC